MRAATSASASLLAARLPPDVTLRLGEHLAEDPHDLVELRLTCDEGRGDRCIMQIGSGGRDQFWMKDDVL